MAMRLNDIPDRLRVMRRSQADLARHLQLDPSSLTKTLKGERRVQPAELVKMESYFGEKLDIHVLESAPGAAPRRKTAPSKIPVYGYAASPGADAIAFGEDKVLDYIDPPPYWGGNGELVYVRMPGETMHPRYFSGQIVPVKLHVPPARGQDCLLELNDDTAIIRTYQGQKDGKVFVQQYGDDPKTYAIEATTVRDFHSVWLPGMI